MREVYYTPEEEQIISTIVPNNTFEELKILLSIDSRNVQRALWNMHCMNKDFVDMWIDTITQENARDKQWAIKHVAFYPNYSSSPTSIRMQCIDVVDFFGLVQFSFRFSGIFADLINHIRLGQIPDPFLDCIRSHIDPVGLHRIGNGF